MNLKMRCFGEGLRRVGQLFSEEQMGSEWALYIIRYAAGRDELMCFLRAVHCQGKHHLVSVLLN